jgi:Tfp pilus assembly protein PilN
MVTTGNGPDGGRKRRIRTGIALSMTELCAADLRLPASSAGGWRRPLDPPLENGERAEGASRAEAEGRSGAPRVGNGSGWPSLAAALADLSRELGITDGTLVVSLMQPLTEVRRLELPLLTDEDVERLLARNAGRYFVNARGAQIVGASRGARPARGRRSLVVAAAAQSRLVAAIRAAARDSGWTVEEIGPAESAWAAAAVTIWPAFSRQVSRVLVTHDDRTDVLTLDDGRLIGVRRFRAGAADAALVADALREDGMAARHVGVFGRSSPRRELVRALSEQGIAVETPGPTWSAAAEFPDTLAAHFAGAENGPRLRGEAARALERVQAKRITMAVAGAAALLFALAAGLELWGVHRELKVVQAERARLRPQLATTLVGRSTIEAAYSHLATLNSVDANAPRWSRVVAALSKHLPEEAFLMALRTRGDSLVVDGLAEHAARVFDALEVMPGLTNVRAAAAVRREVQDDGTALEHFTIAGVVQPVRVETTRSPSATTVARKSEGAP